MKKWKPKVIADLGHIVTGKTPPKANPEYWDGKELFVSPRDLSYDQTYVTSTKSTISTNALEKFKNQRLPVNSVLFTSLSFAFGKVGLASQSCLTNQQINSVVVNGDHDFRFVYYLLRAYKPFIFAFNSGIDTPIVPKSVFEKIEVRCPDRDEQKKIADLLWAYDEMISNSRKRMAVLERISSQIHREWFVRMRFPGYEQTGFKKGVPNGWEVKKLSDVLDLSYGKALKADDRIPGPFHVYGSGGIVGSHSEALVNRPGIIVGRKGNVGAVYYSDRPFFPIDTVYYVESDICDPFLFYLLQSLNFVNNDAAVPGLNRNQAYANQFYLPPAKLIEEFKTIAEPMFNTRFKLSRTIELLKNSRDLLLRRLFAENLKVQDCDIQSPMKVRNESACVDDKELVHA